MEDYQDEFDDLDQVQDDFQDAPVVQQQPAPIMEDNIDKYDDGFEDDNNQYDDDGFDDAPENSNMADKLEQSLNERPSEQQLAGLFKGQNRSSMSNVLSGTAHELEMQMTADAVAHALGNVIEHREEILDQRGSLSNVLAGTAHELERHITADKVAHSLETRPTEEELENTGIQKTHRSTMSDLLAGTAVELERQMTADKVSQALESRPTDAQLEHVGILKNKRGSMSDILASTAVQLEKEMKADVISATISNRASDLGKTPLGARRSSLSNVLAAPAKELEKQLVADSVSAGLSRRSSQQELLQRGVLKRPPSESKIIAATAVSLEKALNTDRLSDRVATTIRAYVGVANAEKQVASTDIPQGLSVKERTDAYMKAVREANSSSKAPSMGPGILERIRAYQEAAKQPSSSSMMEQDDSMTESKTMESPPHGSLKDRMQAYQQATVGKISPKSPTFNMPSLKERMATYQEKASSPRSQGADDVESEKNEAF